MGIDLSRYAPPGVNFKAELQFFLIGMACSFLTSLCYLFRYYNAYSDLRIELKLYGPDMQVWIADFALLLDTGLLGFVVLALCMLCLIFYHYAYHHQGSKSIYLMRRLPDRWERHRRCLTLPLLTALMCLLAAGILLLIYYGIYMAFTPEAHMLPDQWQKLWTWL